MTPENDFAMLDDGVFVGIFRYPEMPLLPGKPYRSFYPVKYETGDAFSGVENGYWVIRRPDPVLAPAPIPNSVLPHKMRLALLNVGKLEDVTTAVSNSTEENKIYWEYAIEFNRNDPLFLFFVAELGFTESQVDDLFRFAGGI